MSLYEQAKRELAARLTPEVAPDPPIGVQRSSTPVTREPVFTPRNFLAGFLDTVPTEILFAYIVALAVISPSQNGAQWGLFGLFLLITPVALYTTVIATLQNRGLRADVPWRAMLLATAGFAAWAALLPDSVFLSVPGYSPLFGVIAVMLLVLVAPVLRAFR